MTDRRTTDDGMTERRATAVRMNDHEAVDLIDRITTLQQEKAALEAERDAAELLASDLEKQFDRAEVETRRLREALAWCHQAAVDIADAARRQPRIMQVRELADAAEGIATQAKAALAASPTPDATEVTTP